MEDFFILGVDGKPHQVLIYDVIGLSYWEDCITAKNIVLALSQIGDDDVDVRINCRGGNHDDGIVIYNVLANHTGNVNIYVEGYACSMGSVITCAGAKGHVKVYETALFMLHRASTYVYGNTHDMAEAAETLAKADSSIAIAYSRKNGKTPEEILSFLDEKRDTWLTPDEAKTFGIVDEIIVPAKFTALLDKSAVTALAAGEGAAILGNVALPPIVKAALEGVSGVVAYRMNGAAVEPIKAVVGDLPKEPDPVVTDEPKDPADDDPETKPEPTKPVVEPVDPVAVERARVQAIMAQAKANGLEGDDIVREMIDDGTTVAAAGKMILAIKRSSQNANHVHGNLQGTQKITSPESVSASWGDAYQSVTKRS